MDVISLVAMSARIYSTRILSYLYASVAYMLSVIVALGVAIAFLLLDMAIALLGGQGGAWIANPLLAIGIVLSTVLGALSFFYLYFGAAGAYMHLCAQIGAGQRDAGISQYAEYMILNAHSFFAISAIPTIFCAAITAGMTVLAILFFGMNEIVAIALLVVALTAWFLVQTPFWFAYAAKVVAEMTAFDAIMESVKIIFRKPIASLAIIFIIYVLALAPAVLVVFYPVYFFVFLSPFVSILTIGFYEVSTGILNPVRKNTQKTKRRK